MGASASSEMAIYPVQAQCDPYCHRHELLHGPGALSLGDGCCRLRDHFQNCFAAYLHQQRARHRDGKSRSHVSPGFDLDSCAGFGRHSRRGCYFGPCSCSCLDASPGFFLNFCPGFCPDLRFCCHCGCHGGSASGLCFFLGSVWGFPVGSGFAFDCGFDYDSGLGLRLCFGFGCVDVAG